MSLPPAQHYQSLISMYAAAPLNQFYQPTLSIQDGTAQVSILVSEKMHHSMGAMHGSVYFKLLDDAAFFAAASQEYTYFVLTADFRVDLLRPVVTGRIEARGTVIKIGQSDILAESKLFDEHDRLLATGIGRFSRGRTPLSRAVGYQNVDVY